MFFPGAIAWVGSFNSRHPSPAECVVAEKNQTSKRQASDGDLQKHTTGETQRAVSKYHHRRCSILSKLPQNKQKAGKASQGPSTRHIRRQTSAAGTSLGSRQAPPILRPALQRPNPPAGDGRPLDPRRPPGLALPLRPAPTAPSEGAGPHWLPDGVSLRAVDGPPSPWSKPDYMKGMIGCGFPDAMPLKMKPAFVQFLHDRAS